MWGRMWSSGHSSDGGDDPEREQCVHADGARKRAARRWTNQGLEPSSSLLRRVTEEYNRRHGRTPSSAAGSSSAGEEASSVALLPVKREWTDELEDRKPVVVKHEPEEIVRRGVVGPKDYVGDDVDAVAAAIIERSLRDEAERRRHNEELEDLPFKQAVATNLAVKDKHDKWQRIRGEQRKMFIDIVSSNEED
ncbi:ABC transporter B family member 25 [Hordeum vulgare]|nr:ABC transporter B family member 25 [Hordeum vulgare]